MATIPTPESMAKEILKIFVDLFKGRPGHVLRVNNFLTVWHQRGLNWEDFGPGLQFAVDKEWIEITESEGFRLTGPGFSEAPSNFPQPQLRQPRTQSKVINNTVNIGTAINSPIAQDVGSNQSQPVHGAVPTNDQLELFVSTIEKLITELKLSEADSQNMLSQTATISAQLRDEQNPQKIREAWGTIKNITEGALGSLVASAAQPGIVQAVRSMLSPFF